MICRGILALVGVCVATSCAVAHPVPKDAHDRTIVIHVNTRWNQVDVRVEYRLEVDELTAFTRDLAPYLDEIDAVQYRGKILSLYSELAQRLGPDLAFRLDAKVNGKRLDFKCVSHKARLHDDAGVPLGHLCCDFVFETSYGPLARDHEIALVFRDGTYRGEEGKIDVSLGKGTEAIRKTIADDAVKKRTALEREPGDDDKLRELRAVFPLGERPAPDVLLDESMGQPEPQTAEPQAAMPAASTAAPEEHGDQPLWRLFWHADYGFFITMLLAALFGAAHALTPGHGKTLVAAYLVGERGTIWHAVVLGIVTTLTHTGVVLVIAVGMFFLPPDARNSVGRSLQEGLGLAMGLIVMCMGVWLLLQRLAGRADHIHVGGGHHHGHPEAGVGSPGSEGSAGAVRWGGLILLGITGGLVPCWDAIVLLLAAVGRSQFLFALPMVLAFSAGLAAVLVLIGIIVVQVPRFAQSRLGYGKIVRALPIVSAVVVTLMGVWLCYEGVHGR